MKFFDIKNIKNKPKLITAITILIVFIMTLGASYAYFHTNVSGTNTTNLVVRANDVDELQFIHGNQVEMSASVQTMPENGGNLSSTTYVGAVLDHKSAGSVSYKYQVYLDITHNGINYSEENTSKKPELMVSATDQNGNEVTLSNLGTKKTVTYTEGVTQKTITGYDITGVAGLKQILVNRSISASTATVVEQRINITVTYVNHDFNQAGSSGQYATIGMIAQKDPITIGTFMRGSEFNAKIKQLAAGTTSGIGNTTQDTLITEIRQSDTIPSEYKTADYAVSTLTSISGIYYPIYAWYDDGTIYWYSEADRVKMNTTASDMFSNLRALETFENFGDVYTNETTDMSRMFYYAGYNSTAFNLVLPDNFDTSSVTSMSYMFSVAGYNSTTWNLDLGDKFDTSSVTNMSSMFSSAGSRANNLSIDLGDKFDTSSVKDMSHMFDSAGYYGTNLSIDLGDIFDTSSVTDMSYMFNQVGYSATTWNLDLGDKFDTSSVTTMLQMFYYAGRNATTWNLDLGDKFDTSSVTTMEKMFYYAGYSATTWTLNLGNHFNNTQGPTMTYMFASAGYSATTFNLDLGDNFNTSAVQKMDNTFADVGHNSQTFSLRLGKSFDTSNVTTMNAMFANAGYSATTWTLDLGDKFYTSSVTNMSYMFRYCGRVATNNFTIDLSKGDFSSVTRYNYMFDGFNTTKGTVYVKDATAQAWVIAKNSGFNTSNVLIKS